MLSTGINVQEIDIYFNSTHSFKSYDMKVYNMYSLWYCAAVCVKALRRGQSDWQVAAQ